MLDLAAAIVALSLQGPIRTTDHVYRAPAAQQVADGWDDLSGQQRERALHNYQRYMQLPDEKRRDIDQRYEKWKRLPGSDKDRYRKKHDEYRGMGLVGDD
jgi:hypothetical protein